MLVVVVDVEPELPTVRRRGGWATHNSVRHDFGDLSNRGIRPPTQHAQKRPKCRIRGSNPSGTICRSVPNHFAESSPENFPQLVRLGDRLKWIPVDVPPSSIEITTINISFVWGVARERRSWTSWASSFPLPGATSVHPPRSPLGTSSCDDELDHLVRRRTPARAIMDSPVSRNAEAATPCSKSKDEQKIQSSLVEGHARHVSRQLQGVA